MYVCACLSVFVKPSTSWMNMSRPTRNTRRINDNQVKKMLQIIMQLGGKGRSNIGSC